MSDIFPSIFLEPDGQISNDEAKALTDTKPRGIFLSGGVYSLLAGLHLAVENVMDLG